MLSKNQPLEINLRIVNREGSLTERNDRFLLFEGRGINFGRGSRCDVCLEDTKRTVSGRHARLDLHQGGVWITDTSRNGTYLNGASDPLPSYKPFALEHGDRLTVGPYEIMVSIGISVDGVNPTSPPRIDKNESVRIPLASDEGETHLVQRGESVNITSSLLSEYLAHKDKDKNSILTSAHPDEQVNGSKINNGNSCGHSTNQVSSFAEESSRWVSGRSDASQIPLGRTSERTMRELEAFLTGLGVGKPSQITRPQDFLRHAGELLRLLVSGVTQTMMGRARFKNELNLGVTVIKPAENNPFKFSATVDDALDRLLLHPGPGFLPAEIAVREVFEDIQAHEIAMTAGLRAALKILLARFEPAEIERRLAHLTGLGQVLTMARKARFWDLFTDTYKEMAAEIGDDFMQTFEEAFTRAYQKQIRILGRARRARDAE